MTSSWTNRLLAALLVFFAGIVVAQETEPPPQEEAETPKIQEKVLEDVGMSEEEMQLAMELGKQMETIMRQLRAYQPEQARASVEESDLPEPLQNLFRGWSEHQKGNYVKASSYFDKVEPDMFQGENYLAGRLTELKLTAEALKDFEVMETKNFSIRYSKGVDEILLFHLPDILERTYVRYSQMFDFEQEEKIIVEIMPDHQLFSYASALTKQQIETTGTIALCVENRLVVLSPRRVLMGYYWPDVIAHEYVHYILTKQSRDHAPLWMQEGVAKFFEARWERDDVNPLDPGLETAMALALREGGELLTVDQMMPSFAALPTAALARQAYAQTTTMIEFISQNHGESVVNRIVKNLGQDGDLDRVMREEVGADFDDFEAAWRDWITTQDYDVHGEKNAAKGVSLLDSDQTDEKIEELKEIDGVARKHARLGDLLLERNRYGAALRQYQKIPRENGRYDRQVLLRLMTCHNAMGNSQDVVRLIDNNIPNLDQDTTMLVRKAQALIGMEERAQARGLLERSIRINPFYPTIYKLLLTLELTEEEQEIYRKSLDLLTNPGAATGKDRKS